MIVSAGLIGMSYYMLIVGQRIKDNLYVEKSTAISGKIDDHQVNDPTNTKL